MPDLFSQQLIECSWRGISFPIEMVGETGSQSLSMHHRMDRDIDIVEPTGRNSYHFKVRAFFLNGLTPGSYETWSPTDLYPTTWLSVKKALEDRSAGTFVHPLYGSVSCNPGAWSTQFVSDVRNGVIVEMEFIETAAPISGLITLAPSIISSATSSAANLDQSMIGFDPTFATPQAPRYGKNAFSISFGTPFGFSAYINFPTLLGFSTYSAGISYILSLPAPQALQQCQVLITSLYSFNASLQQAPDSYAYLLDISNGYIVALEALLPTFTTQSLATGTYITAAPITLATVASFVSNSIDNIMALNPSLVKYAIIPSKTPITYYIP